MTTTLPTRRSRAGAPGAAGAAGHGSAATSRGAGRDRRQLAYVVVLAVVVTLGVVTRFVSTGDLWLDEALTVNIASLPPHQLLQALRVDGSPPLYYALLHVWISVFGSGTAAVRTLSGIFSTAALIPAYYLGRRVGGRQLATTTLVLLACTPYALRFGSETRMYSLVLLEVCLGGVALLRALESPTIRRLAPVTLITLALALTHYWTFFLLAAVAGWLLATRRFRVLGAMVAAGVLFTPQLPTLFFQLSHTGTPWAPPTQPRAVIDTLLDWGGPTTQSISAPLGFVTAGIALLGATAVRMDDGRLVINPRAQRAGLSAAWLAVGTLCLAVAATMAAGAGFVERYTAIAVPAYIVLVGLGLLLLPQRAGRVLLLAIAVLGLFTGHADAIRLRTQAGQIAAALTTSTAPGDVIVYCPDQLAPAINRVAPPGRTQVSYGDPLGPSRVDWVDYAQRNAQLDPAALAAEYDAMAGPTHAVALVYAEGYRTLTGQCSALAGALGALRPVATSLIGPNSAAGEPSSLTLFAATAGTPLTAASTSAG